MNQFERNYEKALKWVHQNTIDGNGITLSRYKHVIYPEVTGYFIPTLLDCGEDELARSYAKYLISIQKPDGSWYDSDDKAPYVFDSAQILKGLMAIHKMMPGVEKAIIRGVDWVLSNMQDNGRLTTPCKDAWGNDEHFCSEIIHMYCLSPIRDAGEAFGIQQYIDSAERIMDYYLNMYRDKILNFDLLSHFHAYVMEALFDMGRIELCEEAMVRFASHCNAKGAILGRRNLPWVCSTGCFQAALVWYKLGKKPEGDKQFEYACKLQNQSGGWYGSYPSNRILNHFYPDRKRPGYFGADEISWAVKYFLDAYHCRIKWE